MPRVDFVISNDRHHTAMTRPVVERLAEEPSYRCRVISLCELRGLASPEGAFPLTVPLHRVVPRRFRRSPALGRTRRAGGVGPGRRLAHALTWPLVLARPLENLWRERPDLVVLPNDAAFPYDRIARRLGEREIPFLLLQEGIRFPLPAASGEEGYGRGGAAAVAAWGEASAEYFRRQGVPAEKIHLTGNPRFDHLATAAGPDPAVRLSQELGLGPGRPLLLLTNPIDDQGFCSTAGKMALVGRFLEGLAPLYEERGDLQLVIKLHARESEADYRRLAAGLPFAGRVTVTRDAPLYPLFDLAAGAVILASTVGLEALLFGLSLGVLELPGHGFLYDYVERGAARGLAWHRPMAEQVRELLAAGADGDRVRAYLDRNFATRHDAALRVARLIVALTERS